MQVEPTALRLPKLDARLSAIASLVRPGVRCADIGTDHGHLIAWLAASGRILSGFACDINRKPLDKAACSLSEFGVSDRVKLILCDGLSGLHPGEVDDIVIAGMGGDLIWEILSTQSWTRDPALRFLLQPMTKTERLRRSLWENGFEILREEPAEAGGFPYTVLQTAYTGKVRHPSQIEAYTGLLWQDSRPAAINYLEKVTRQVREKVEGLSASAQNREEYMSYRTLLTELESRCKK